MIKLTRLVIQFSPSKRVYRNSKSVMERTQKQSKEDTDNNFVTTERIIEGTATETLEDDDQAAPEIFVEPPIKLMPTLPQTFKSLVGCPISITKEDRNPQNIITLLGNALGVNDYKTNMASFWFLDFIALQVLLFENALDNHERSVMVSWLAGEMKFIRENNLSHDAFLRDMQNIFIKSSEKMSRGQRLLHWDLIDDESKREDVIIEEDTEQEPKEPEVSQLKIMKRRVSSKSRSKRIRSKDRSNHSAKTLERAIIDEPETISNDEDMAKSEIHSNDILDIIMEATYNMYGNSFHYALIIAAFVNPVQLHEYKLPFKFREPRPIKIFEIDKNTEKSEREKGQDSGPARKSKEMKKKKMDGKKSKKNEDDERIEVVEPVTPVALTDEEILMKKREFILPLMEANEASSILETYREISAK